MKFVFLTILLALTAQAARGQFLPTKEERVRKDGNGIYYHVSYWGRPYDNLWLGTFSIYLLYQQMKQACDYSVRKIWK